MRMSSSWTQLDSEAVGALFAFQERLEANLRFIKSNARMISESVLSDESRCQKIIENVDAIVWCFNHFLSKYSGSKIDKTTKE